MYKKNVVKLVAAHKAIKPTIYQKEDIANNFNPTISTGSRDPLLLEPFRHVELFIEHMSYIFLVSEVLEKWKNDT